MCVFESKTCKVDESEFKIDGGEISIVVEIHSVDKGEIKYSGSECKLIMKSHVFDESELKLTGWKVKLIIQWNDKGRSNMQW